MKFLICWLLVIALGAPGDPKSYRRITPFQFGYNNQFPYFFEQMNKYNQGLAASLQNQGNIFNTFGIPNRYPGYFENKFGSFGGSSASATFGPGGYHQTASVYPQNPKVPDIDTRFSESGNEGSYGIFTSSQSASSNINGTPNHFHQASTTINDNGKVTTYTVHNP